MRDLFLFLILVCAQVAYSMMPPKPQNCSEILAEPKFHSTLSQAHFKDHESVLMNLVSKVLDKPDSALFKADADLQKLDFQLFHQTFRFTGSINGFVGPTDTIQLRRYYKDSDSTRLRILFVTISVTSIYRNVISASIQKVENSFEIPVETAAASTQTISILVTIDRGSETRFEDFKSLLVGTPFTVDEAYGLILIDPVGPKYAARVTGAMADLPALDKIPGLAGFSDPSIGPTGGGIGIFGPPQK